MKKQNNKAFTLVELIVVITILAVLATVAFISFQWYTSSSRDSVRLADLSSISRQLNNYLAKNNQLPLPDNSKNAILNDGLNTANVFLQWNIWKTTSWIIWIFDAQDPLTKNPYLYSVLKNKLEFQVAASLENSQYSYITPQAYVSNPSARVTWNYNSTPFVPSLLIANITDNYEINRNLDDTFFIYNNWPNLPYSINNQSVENLPYKNQSTKNFVKWLIAHYSLNENSIYTWSWWQVFIKDRSWNNYDISWFKNNDLVRESDIVYENWGLKFSKDWIDWLQAWFCKNIPEDILYNEINNGFTVLNRVYNEYNSTWNKRIFSLRRSFKIWSNMKYFIWFNPIRIVGDKLEVIEWIYDDLDNNWIFETRIDWWENAYQSKIINYVSWYATYITVYDYKLKERKFYLNWELQNVYSFSNLYEDIYNREYNSTNFCISSHNPAEVFNWSIINSLIYNRPLDENEIIKISEQNKYFQ